MSKVLRDPPMICKHCKAQIPKHGFSCKGETYKNIGEWLDDDDRGGWRSRYPPPKIEFLEDYGPNCGGGWKSSPEF